MLRLTTFYLHYTLYCTSPFANETDKLKDIERW